MRWPTKRFSGFTKPTPAGAYLVTGADDTGASDVTAALLAFIATVPDGTAGSPNRIVFGKNKRYRIDLLFQVTSRNWLIFDGNGSTLFTDVDAPYGNESTDRTRSHFRLLTCSNIRVTNLTIIGANVNAGLSDDAYYSPLEAQHGFESLSSTNITVDRVTIDNVYGDWIYCGVAGALGLTDGVLIELCTFGKNGRQGMSFVGCQNVEVRYCTTGLCRRSLMDFEPNGASSPAFNIYVHDNTFGLHRLSFVASKGAVGECSNITVSRNTCVSAISPVLIEPPAQNTRSNWVITDNSSETGFGSASGNAWYVRWCDGLTITGNTQPMQPGRNMVLVSLDECTNYVVSGNTITDAIGQFQIV